MSKNEKAGTGGSDLVISYGGYASVDRVEALVRNAPSIRGMILPVLPSRPDSSQSTENPGGGQTPGNRGNRE